MTPEVWIAAAVVLHLVGLFLVVAGVWRTAASAVVIHNENQHNEAAVEMEAELPPDEPDPSEEVEDGEGWKNA